MTDVYWYFSFGLLCLFHQGETKVYESVQWTAQSPKFGDEVFHLNVLPNSMLNIVCPNPAIVVAEMNDTLSKEQLLENFWIVDESSFNNCAVNTSNAYNRILMRCIEPSKMNFLSLVFQQFSAFSDDPRFLPGEMYYFISTSDGTVKSLNNTSNGHCQSRNMRMQIYVCRDSQDEACQPTKVPSLSHKNATTVELATQESRKSPPRNIWHLLTIIFGVDFAISLVIHSMCLFCVCHRKRDKKQSMKKACLHPQKDEMDVENIQVSCNV